MLTIYFVGTLGIPLVAGLYNEWEHREVQAEPFIPLSPLPKQVYIKLHPNVKLHSVKGGKS